MGAVIAADLARRHGIDPKRFRQALRNARLPWYRHGASWSVDSGSPQHRDLLRVLGTLLDGKQPVRAPIAQRKTLPEPRTASDEVYVIGLCDTFLGLSAIRQHGFDFLRGDPGANGQGRTLPVDAWYAELDLVVEYRERQHSEAVALFDRRATVSGVCRSEQRRLYDQRRRDILPLHGITLIEFDFFDFEHNSSRRLVRCAQDARVAAAKLARYLG